MSLYNLLSIRCWCFLISVVDVDFVAFHYFDVGYFRLDVYVEFVKSFFLSFLYVVSVKCSSFAMTHPSVCSFITIVSVFNCVRLFTKQFPRKHYGLRNLELWRWIILRYYNDLMCLWPYVCGRFSFWKSSSTKYSRVAPAMIFSNSAEADLFFDIRPRPDV